MRPSQGIQTDSLYPIPLLLFAAVVLIFMFLMGSVLSQNVQKEQVKVPFSQTTILRIGNQAPPKISAKAAFAIDLESKQVLFSKNPDEPLLPASTTKITTALVTLAHYDLDEILIVEEVEDIDGQKMDLVEGEKISVQNLLYGLLVSSANDAAEVLAASYPGGRENFISAMNQTAKIYGLSNTHFANPTGFDEFLHFSTARDLAILAARAIENPTFAKIVATPKTEVTSVDGEIAHKLVNINQLVGKIPGVVGVKTGWTINSGESLVTLVKRNGESVLIALLGSQDRFGETEDLIDWIFSVYSWDSSETP